MTKSPVKRRAADGWGVALSHRNLSAVLQGIAMIQDQEERIAELRKAPAEIKQFLYFVLGNFDLDIPKEGNFNYRPIPPEAFSEDPALGDEDLLAHFVPKLVRLFSREVHPTLTSKRRLQLWLELVERLPESERTIMDYARKFRALPWPSLSRGVVASAFPDMLDKAPERDAPVPGIEYPPSMMDNPIPIHDPAAPAQAPAPQAPRHLNPAPHDYNERMRNLGFAVTPAPAPYPGALPPGIEHPPDAAARVRERDDAPMIHEAPEPRTPREAMTAGEAYYQNLLRRTFS
jgi:hypothetical protein